MQSGWVDADAEALVARTGQPGVDRDLALRVYTTRLLGRDPKLVLHGGGNTSLKSRRRDRLGEDVEVLYVKATGANMADADAAGFCAVRLEPMRRLRALDHIGDIELVAIERANLIDPAAPNPSVEMMLHAFLPHKFIDHTHATAVLSVIDQPDGEQKCTEIFDGRLGFVPYVMPGFGLAKKAIAAFERDKPRDGLILSKHGIVTYGGEAREAYERMIETVSLAEAFIARHRKSVAVSVPARRETAAIAAVAPIVRGACSQRDDTTEGAWRRLIVEFRDTAAVLAFLERKDLARLSESGVITPDHTIRTKNWPLVLPDAQGGRLEDFARATREAAQTFATRYQKYFAHHNARVGGGKRELDPLPRVVLVPGLGLFGLGPTKARRRDRRRHRRNLDRRRRRRRSDRPLRIDFRSRDVRLRILAARTGKACPHPSVPRGRRGFGRGLPLAGQIAAVTGAGGAIGAATAKAFAAAGAEVALLDVDLSAARDIAAAIGPTALALACDVTDALSVNAAFENLAEHFGGVDMVVSNAGAAWQGRIGDVAEDIMRKSFELNFYGHQRVAQAAVKIMLAQGTGGCLLFNVSKQAVNPGPNFGPYGIPKAAALALMRQYALDYGSDGIRANAVNADRIRSGLLTPDMITSRSRARGVSEKDYMSGNLLGREVTAEDVAQAFLHQALELKTTADVTTVDGGNIAAAMR